MVEKIGPYRVYERLGVGGMGEVFKAYDDRLDRWVAIKRIRPDREDAEDNRERFKREARATARLNHPAIVHLYGIFQEGDSDCIVMEYVEGRTLDSILAEGPLDPLRVASLGHEIASGLAEAHANGILHRDLKAENIIITPRGRSKILDFGLAKPILRSELDPVLTGKGQLVGTSRAMSPEYVSGDNVDHRSDLFALGVLLYETLTGQSPFKAHNTLATLKQVMLHRQTPVKQLVPKVPQELSDLIDRLLEKDPTDRPQSAHEVALAFGRLTGQISSGAVEQPSSGTQPIFKPTTSTGAAFSASDTVLDLRPRSRWMTVVVVLVALLITAFFLGRYLSKADKVKPKPGGEPVKVLVGDFKNTTGKEEYDLTVSGLFRTSLGQSESLSLLGPVQIQEALGRMQRSPNSEIDVSLGAELAQREGAQWLIVGDISAIGSQYVIAAQVIRPEDQVVRFTRSATAKNEDGIISAVESVGNEVRASLGETAAEIERTSQPLQRVTTPNFEALRAYTLGFEKSLQPGQSDKAIPLLERALEFDPAFAMAHAKLVAIYSSGGNRDKALEHIEAAKRYRDRLPEVEKFYIDGWTFRWTGTPQDVERNWAEMSEFHPKELAGHRNLGFSLWYYKHDLAGAASAFEKALAVAEPARKPSVAELLGYCLLGSGQLANARPIFDLAAKDDKSPLIDFLLATDATEEADRLIQEVTSGESRFALVKADRGDLETAESALKQQLRNSQAPPAGNSISTWMYFADLAAVLFYEGKREELIQLATELTSTATPHLMPVGLATDTSPLTTMTLVGKLLARSGDTTQARGIAQLTSPVVKSVNLPLWNAHQKMLEAEILMAEFRHEPALAQLDSALGMVDLVTLHESKATCLEKLGRTDSAIAEWRVVAGSRARAFAEGYQSSFGRLFSICATSWAWHEIARIGEAIGNENLANQQRKEFALRWPYYPSL
jgi:serine/threonine protein kinase/tetratricopeptide (TPR) repeat protein